MLSNNVKETTNIMLLIFIKKILLCNIEYLSIHVHERQIKLSPSTNWSLNEVNEHSKTNELKDYIIMTNLNLTD